MSDNRKVWLNGKIVPPEEAKVSVFSQAVLRGGSYYQPQGSRWYFPQAYRLDEHGKYLLMAPSLAVLSR